MTGRWSLQNRIEGPRNRGRGSFGATEESIAFSDGKTWKL